MTFEVIKRADGSYGWQLRDEHGAIVERPRGGGAVLPPDAEADERSRLGVQEALRLRYEEQQAART